jgi:hypothetical protein
MRKMIHVGTAAFDALQTLASDTGTNFQELMDEAIGDLLKKHKRPVTVKEMFDKSLAKGRRAK